MVDPRTAQLSRRGLLTVLASALPVGGCVAARDDVSPRAAAGAATSGDDPWQILLEGNARFASAAPSHPRQDDGRRRSLVDGQHPVASVLTCADSRVPPELIFDQGLGDLFTIRSAGEVLDHAVIGSVEYAVEHLRVPLIVVLGHTGCGAVGAAVDVFRGGTRPRGHIGTLVRQIEPTVRAVADGRGVHAVRDDDFAAACVDEQARRVAATVSERSPIVAAAVAGGTTTVVAGVYDLAGGRVSTIDG